MFTAAQFGYTIERVEKIKQDRKELNYVIYFKSSMLLYYESEKLYLLQEDCIILDCVTQTAFSLSAFF